MVTGHGTDETAVLDGFHITAGLADGSTYYDTLGAGLYNDNGSPTLTHLSFSGNRADGIGGGMFNGNSSSTLTHVSFSNNRAGVGGGIFNLNSSLTFTGGALSGNAAHEGGGLFNIGTADHLTTLTGVRIIGNTALTDMGGGIFNADGAQLLLINSLLEQNQAYNYGGGLSNHIGTATLINTTVAGNTAGNQGGGVLVRTGAVALLNSIAYGNTASDSGDDLHNANGAPALSYSLYDENAVSGDMAIDANSINADPLFADPAGGNWRLSPGSPAIDAGTDVPYEPDGLAEGVDSDLDGSPRIHGNAVDLGPYEFSGESFDMIFRDRFETAP